MGRPYTREIFHQLVTKIRHYLPDAAIGVDVLTGFPGESDDAFENTYNLIQELPISYLHVFPFSSRPGTPAAHYAHKVHPDVIKMRCSRMRTLGAEKRLRFYQQFVGQRLDVLIESKRDRTTGRLKGLTSNYIPVLIDAADNRFNKRVCVKIDKIHNNTMPFGTIFR